MKIKLILIISIFLIINSCQNSEWEIENNSIRPIYKLSENEYSRADFKEIEESQLNNRDFWITMHHSNYEVAVEIKNGELILAEPDFGKAYFEIPYFEFEDGKLEIINRGEFGGALNFIPYQNLGDTISIWNVPINFVFRFKKKVYFLVGIAHGMDSGGALFELKRENGKFSYKEIVRLDSAPEAVSIYKNKILIAGHKMFTVIEDFEKDNIVKEAFWHSLYPNSISVKNDDEVYIGMRCGYSKLSLNSKEVKYFQYKEK